MSEVQSIQLPAAGSVTSQTASNGWRSLLESNMGRRVVAEFLIGQDGMAEKTGEIYAVQSDYFLLKDDNGNYVASDLFSRNSLPSVRAAKRPPSPARQHKAKLRRIAARPPWW